MSPKVKAPYRARDNVKDVIITLDELAKTCMYARNDDIYTVARDFFKNILEPTVIPVEHRGGEGSMVSVDLTNVFRHKTIYNRIMSSTLEVDILTIPKTDEEVQYLHDILENCMIFERMDIEGKMDFIGAMTRENFNPGDCVIAVGDLQEKLYIVGAGLFKSFIDIPGTNLRMLKERYTEGNIFCKDGMLATSLPCNYTIEATTQGSVWSIHRDIFFAIDYKSKVQRRNRFNNVIGIVPMLSQLESEEKFKIADAFELKTYSSDEIILREEGVPDGIYFIEKGSAVCEVYDENIMNFVEVSKLKAGQYFGELQLIEKSPFNEYRVTALEYTVVAFLEGEGFHRLLKETCLTTFQKSIYEFKSAIDLARGMRSEMDTSAFQKRKLDALQSTTTL